MRSSPQGPRERSTRSNSSEPLTSEAVAVVGLGAMGLGMAHVLAGDYTPLSAVDIFVKDLGPVLDTARASKFPLPLSATAHQMFMQASAPGHGREDDSAVVKVFPGIELPPKG